MELKNAADRYELLEKENQAKSVALDAAKETRSEIRDARRSFDRPEKSWLEAPFCCG